MILMVKTLLLVCDIHIENHHFIIYQLVISFLFFKYTLKEPLRKCLHFSLCIMKV